MVVESPPVVEQELPTVGRATTLFASFGYAFAGLWYLLRTQRNAQIHLCLAAMAITLGLALGLARWEWLVLVLTCALVLACEGVNTAIEAVVDLASPGYHQLAKVAKDVAAGTVLLSAICSIVVALLLFVPHLWPLLRVFLEW